MFKAFSYIFYRWIYWIDRLTETLERATIQGDAIWTLQNNVRCVWPLTLNYYTHTVYWIDYCNIRLESVRMEGSPEKNSLPVSNVELSLSFGITDFEDFLYWTQSNTVLSINKTAGLVEEVYSSSSGEGIDGIKLVHPSKQPPGQN